MLGQMLVMLESEAEELGIWWGQGRGQGGSAGASYLMVMALC